MKVIVKGKQLDVGDSLESHVQKNLLETVHKYFHNPIEANVIFSKDSHLLKAEILVHASNHINLESSAEDTDIYRAFDQANHKITKRLRRYKSKLRDNHHKDHKQVRQQAYTVTANFPNGHDHDAEDENAPMIIADMDQKIETMTVSEAVLRMDLGKSTAYMFRNSAHGDLNMVYRRLDGNIGWVDPKGTENTHSNG